MARSPWWPEPGSCEESRVDAGVSRIAIGGPMILIVGLAGPVASECPLVESGIEIWALRSSHGGAVARSGIANP